MTTPPTPADAGSDGPAPEPAPEPMSDAEFERWYGRWAAYTPAEVAQVLDGFAGRWWIVGGWAVDAFSGVEREHEDIDVAFLRADLPALLDHLGPTHCIWTNFMGTIRPLRRPTHLIEGSRQLWVRRDATQPWVIDLAMTPHDGDTWIANRDARVRRPLADATFEGRDGFRYLRPELVLFMKAKFARPKDVRDLDVCLPKMSPSERERLRAAIELAHPGHPWLDRIQP